MLVEYEGEDLSRQMLNRRIGVRYGVHDIVRLGRFAVLPPESDSEESMRPAGPNTASVNSRDSQAASLRIWKPRLRT